MDIIVFALGVMLIAQGVKAVIKEKEEKKTLEEEKREAEDWGEKNIEENIVVAEDKKKTGL